MDIDLHLACAVIRDGIDGLMSLHRAGVTSDIIYGTGKAVIEFVDGFFKKYGEVPKPGLIEDTLGIEVVNVEEPVEYFIDRVLERRVFNLGKKCSVKLAEALEKGKPYEAADIAREYFRQSAKVGSGGKVVPLASLISAVKEDYLEAKSGKRGILTPWSSINKISLGFKPGDLVVVVGRLGTGKTYLLMIMAEKAWAQGKKVLVVCTEMTKERLAARLIAVRFKVPYGLLREGKLSYPIEKRLFEKMDELSNDDSFMLIGDDFDINVSVIEAAIEQAQPDIVFVDGLYLVRGNSKFRDRYTAVAEIADELKRMARRHKIPIVASTQFNRDVSANDTDDIRAEHVAMSDTIGWNADILLGLYQTDDMRQDQELGIRPMKVREGDTGNDIIIRWDFEAMDFEEIGGETDIYTDDEFAEIGDEGIGNNKGEIPF